MRNRLVVDRVVGDMAVVENAIDGAMVDIPLADLPSGVKEGDTLIRSENGFNIADNTQARRDIRAKMDRLIKK